MAEQLVCRVRQIGHRLREVAPEQLAVHEGQEDGAPAVSRDQACPFETRVDLVRKRLLREQDGEVGGSGRLTDGGRRPVERALTRPELEPRRGAGVGHGRDQLGAFLDQGLFDDDERVLARLQPGEADQVPGPAGML
jgi:hypothetical protein